MRIEALNNGMILLDNGEKVLQVRKEFVESIMIFPPDPDMRSPEYRENWYVQVLGAGHIIFFAPTKDEADKIRNTISNELCR